MHLQSEADAAVARICIFSAGEIPGQAEMCLSQARRYHPDANFVHMTDTQTERLPGVDECWRGEWDGQIETVFLLRAQLLSLIDDRPTIYLDSDTLVRGSLGRAFTRPFQVGLTYRDNKGMRYNAGVMFSRSRAFWVSLLDRIEHGPRHYMMTECALADEVDTKKWDVAEFPCSVWNNYWMSKLKMPKAKVLHYKGARKKWMREHYRELAVV